MRVLGILIPLLLAGLALPPAQAACLDIPCGRVFPTLLVELDDDTQTFPLGRAEELSLAATLTYRFDAANDGYAPTQPGQDVVVTFEYPRKPAWAEVSVEPERIVVPINDATRLSANPDEMEKPLHYEWSTPITIKVRLVGQAILRDGQDYGKLLIFAKSTESGIYQSGYGIKEVRVAPEGVLHEKDVPGEKDTYLAQPLPSLALTEQVKRFGGTTVTLTPPPAPAWWQPGEWRVRIDPPFAGHVLASFHDEGGNLMMSSHEADASQGGLALNLTLVKPGHHTALVSLRPEPGSRAPPVTFGFDFQAGGLDAEGWTYPKEYVVSVGESVPAPLGNTAEALAQFECDVPFYASELAHTVRAELTLRAASSAVPGLAALQFSLLDPQGEPLQAGSVDPSVPTKELRAGSLPMEGWYTLRIRGVGLPQASAYDARIQVNYITPLSTRNTADGTPDATGGMLGQAGRHASLTLDAIPLWAPHELAPNFGVPGAYHVSIVNASGALVYASGLRAQERAAFTALEPGLHRAFLYVTPNAREAPFAPAARAFTFTIPGAADLTSFRVEDAFEARAGAGESVLGFQALPNPQGRGEANVEAGSARVDTVDEAGEPSEGGRILRVRAQHVGAEAARFSVGWSTSYATAQTLTEPESPPATQEEVPLPSPLVLVGLGAVAAWIWRRRAG